MRNLGPGTNFDSLTESLRRAHESSERAGLAIRERDQKIANFKSALKVTAIGLLVVGGISIIFSRCSVEQIITSLII